MPDQSDNQPPKTPDPPISFWQELKRRKVMRVGITYGIVAWLLIQVSATMFPQFEIQEWGARIVPILLLTGFPIAIILTSFDEYLGIPNNE